MLRDIESLRGSTHDNICYSLWHLMVLTPSENGSELLSSLDLSFMFISHLPRESYFIAIQDGWEVGDEPSKILNNSNNSKATLTNDHCIYAIICEQLHKVS